VQGEAAPAQIVAAIPWINQQAEAPEVLVVIRGGGSADDLAAFSAEPVVRAVAASRVPTLVAIGHEIDTSLAELAADARASTPSNAAELLVPDRRDFIGQLQELRLRLGDGLLERLREGRRNLDETLREIDGGLDWLMEHERREVINLRRLAQAYNPALALARGYAVVRGADGTVARTPDQLAAGKTVTIRSAEAEAVARIESVKGVDHGKSL
jgi:exodeoxyribonuclease VII large subunit